ncbi:MAG: DNA-directed RNA polymerase subunit beta' [Candidatus Margulisiibacteriota bacterium]
MREKMSKEVTTWFDYLKIGLVSTERILSWSHGEVEKPETINYRTFKPERKGLFCEKIFGPVKDWECHCGRYRRVRYRGIICERCGVEVTTARVRRERMAHIRLCVPVAHIWFLRSIPGYISLLLDIPNSELDTVIYYDSYIVTEVSDNIKNKVKVGEVLNEGTYQDLKEKYGNAFKADTGTRPIKELLSRIDLKDMVKSLRKALKDSTGQKRIKIVKRLRVAEAFVDSGNRPEWMILEVLPVMPPELRPMVQLEGGRFATSDLNDLYRRVLNRNNRLKKMIAMGAPEMIIRNEKRMLQEAVDVLIDNGRRKRAVTGSTGRPLKSLTDIIEGKQGRFRQNLLGKRVDYSGRSVIVVGPHLKMHQCGLPKGMALELFKPFVIRKLVEKGLSQNVKSAKRQIERKDIVVWDILEEVIQGQVVLLNRAPTLHRLGIQAFEPVLVEGKAIQIHPLVCTAFNADFDGDQMAVHVPILPEAQVEARIIMLSSHNLMSPASGRPVMTPSQDLILGTYYMTYINEADTEEPKIIFSGDDEAMLAHDCEEIHLHTPIKVMRDGEIIKTTVGRVKFNYTLSRAIKRSRATGSLPFMNYSFDKKKVEQLIKVCYTQFGSTITAEIADEIKRLGFKYATLAGISIGVEDLKVPARKKEIIEKAEKQIEHLRRLEKSKSITSKEKANKTMEIWSDVTQNVTHELIEEFKQDELNSVYLMAYSGARGSMDQVRQLSGIRGLMADKEGDIHPIPIKSNFKEGLTVTEYFISSYGARKGLVDTALRTADSGYLTRRLVDVAQDVMITAEDCETKNGLVVSSIWERADEILPLKARIVGRNSAQKVSDPVSGKVIVNVGEEITEAVADKIAEAGIENVKVRSPLTCQMKKGICQMCYGRNLATGNPIDIGEAVGTIAAQSIGEPGTQLTMRTFHIGGVALHKKARVIVKHAGKISFGDGLSIRTIRDAFDNKIDIVTRESAITVKSKNREEVYPMQVGSIIKVSDGESVKAASVIAEVDSTYEYVVATTGGKIKIFGVDFIERKKKVEDKTVIEILAENEGMAFVYNPKVVKEYDTPKGAKIFAKLGDNIDLGTELAAGITAKVPGVVIDIEENSRGGSVVTAQGEFCRIQSGAQLMIKDGDVVEDYDIIAREVTSDTKKTKDIIQGLPKVEELFEARKPKDAALISEIDGKVDLIDKEGSRQLSIEGDGEKVDYIVPYETRLRVSKGDKVRKGAELTYGEPNPHDVLRIQGAEAAQKLIVNEVQKIYRGQGVTIHDKHIETVVRQMTKKIRIVTPGNTLLLPGELIEKLEFDKVCEETKGEKSTATPVLLGITKASLMTDSFISAASFQETARILTEAAVKGKTDEMYGLKENVIIGRLIPSGTGFAGYRYVESEPAHKSKE